MTNKEALRLADSISRMDTFTEYQRGELQQAAAELRRLHKVEKHAEWLSDEISELKILDAGRLHSLQVAGEMYESLQEKSSELVKVMEQAVMALEFILKWGHCPEADDKAQAVITALQNALKGTT